MYHAVQGKPLQTNKAEGNKYCNKVCDGWKDGYMTRVESKCSTM